jgi:hypothetical protein
MGRKRNVCLENHRRAFHRVRLNEYNPIDSGFRLTITMDYEVPHSFLGKLLDKLLIYEALGSEFDEGLKELKALLEK